MVISRSPKGWGFPTKMKMTHKYADVFTSNAATGTLGSATFSANGMFDPDITGTGHQPMFFDTMSAIYDHYTVFASKIIMKFLVTSTANFVLYVDDDTTTATSMAIAIEQPSATHIVASALAAKQNVVTKSWNAKQYFGGDIYDNDNLQGTAAANPVEQSYYVYKWQEVTLTQSVQIQVQLEIYYEAVWDELKTQVQS